MMTVRDVDCGRRVGAVAPRTARSVPRHGALLRVHRRKTRGEAFGGAWARSDRLRVVAAAS